MKELFRSWVVRLLTLEAKAVLRRYAPNVVLVTGSVGKTSAKDALFTTLAPRHFVRKSQKSFNSDIGAPLTILGVPNGWSNPIRWLRNLLDGAMLLIIRAPYPEWLIVEVGADRPGDITRSLSWLKPRVVVATRFPTVPVHVEFYDSPEAVQEEELSPLLWLKPGSVAVVNEDDEVVSVAELPEGVERLSFGFGAGADVRAQRIKTLTEGKLPRGTSFDVTYKGERVHVTLADVVGGGHVYAALAGIAGALATGVPLSVAALALESHQTPPGRMHLVPGIRKSMLLDDTYNASPVAVEEALATLEKLPHRGRRIAVLGDMLELGAYSVSEHHKVGVRVAHAADIVVTVGMRARKTAEATLEKGFAQEAVFQFDRALDAAEHLKSIVGDGDVILIKGSQGMRLERAVKELMAEPERAKELLCRQDAEWLTR
jgi:UDP-N-acetylmuramoyl-tripeptide--D-alanyl-D-alanine ligase